MDRELEGITFKKYMSGASPQRGVDEWIDEFCKERGYLFEDYPPDFKSYGSPKAFFMRNRKMVDSAQYIWGFLAPDAITKSGGTIFTVNYALKSNKFPRLLRITPIGVIDIEKPWR